MAHDIIIRSGRIVDGLLNPEHISDVAIDGDTITPLGEVDRRGTCQSDYRCRTDELLDISLVP